MNRSFFLNSKNVFWGLDRYLILKEYLIDILILFLDSIFCRFKKSFHTFNKISTNSTLNCSPQCNLPCLMYVELPVLTGSSTYIFG